MAVRVEPGAGGEAAGLSGLAEGSGQQTVSSGRQEARTDATVSAKGRVARQERQLRDPRGSERLKLRSPAPKRSHLPCGVHGSGASLSLGFLLVQKATNVLWHVHF